MKITYFCAIIYLSDIEEIKQRVFQSKKRTFLPWVRLNNNDNQQNHIKIETRKERKRKKEKERERKRKKEKRRK